MKQIQAFHSPLSVDIAVKQLSNSNLIYIKYNININLVHG